MFQEIKNLVHHSFIYWIGVILAKVVGFLLIPVYTRYLTPADYGTIELLFLTADIAALAIGLQMTQGVFRFYHSYETKEEKNRLISTALFSILAVSVIMIIGFNVFARPITLLVFGSESYIHYLRFYSFVYPLNLIIEIPFALIRIKKQSRFYVFCSLINFVFMISLNIFFIVYMGWGIWGVLVSPAITFTMLAIFLLKRTFSEVGFSFSFSMMKQVLKFSTPLIPASLGMFALHFSDRYFVKHFCSLSDVGIYSLGYKFGFILSAMVIQPFNLIWQTYMYELAKKANAPQIYGRVLTYFTFVLVFAGLLVSVPINEVIRIMATPAFYGASTVVPFVAFAYALSGINTVFQTGLFINSKTHWIGSITFSSAIGNLIANYLLISRLGIMGAAISTFGSFLFMTGLTFYFSYKVYPINIEYVRIAKLACVALLVLVLSKYLEIGSILYSLCLKTLLILAFFFVLFLINFLDSAEKQKLFGIKRFVLGRFYN
jgi:O-antigen/teichoic acid export membrane protein